MSSTNIAVRRIALVANTSKPAAEAIARHMTSYFLERGILIDIFTSGPGVSTDIVVRPDTDLAISLGGDGTVLYCARSLLVHQIPILAVNLGTFGYITEVAANEWQEAYEQYISRQSHISQRLMIQVSVLRKGELIWQRYGLNEAAINASGISKIVHLELLVNGTKAGLFRSDGMLICTPTGSTGYNLASGGPILDVDLSALIITPICPFTLSNRPLVIGEQAKVEVIVPHGQRTEVMLTVDGQQNCKIVENDVIVVQKAEKKALLVTSERRNFIEVIRDKLSWSGGMHA
ncbi:NAD(+)/NADH kinase [Parasphaerochaeta coccoides]|uniref:NAD kinase n=1 Tax=Parasphaerochaeta coccoides (strain ATCC BAA-1237 / DSM 17374 / SPN1) TaxID=760011 RepID=F4GKX6_PARC1|nr:NAD(+)/NADH kinase [Parasphaerochaeta coccoides]AEC01889.1 inorganic polyphosphate/ATP-NAD kinase [Parasphaerochaeta coccoides DSM 17374]